MRVEQVLKLFPNIKYKIVHTSSGLEVMLEKCPIDIKNLGSKHPNWKTYINPEKETLKCFVCHPPKQGMKLHASERILRRRFNSVSKVQKDMRKDVLELPDIPETLTVEQCQKIKNHPMLSYLKFRRISPEVAYNSGLLWKNIDIPAWYKTNEETKEKKEVGKYPGIIIPIKTRNNIVGWQLCAVPRLKNVPKYITAPHSRLAGALYNFDNIKNNYNSLVIVEGVFDALRIPEFAVALLCDRINKRKKRLISTGMFNQVILCLDDDRTEEHIQKELNFIRGIAPCVRSVILEKGDPADYDRDELLTLIFGKV